MRACDFVFVFFLLPATLAGLRLRCLCRAREKRNRRSGFGFAVAESYGGRDFGGYGLTGTKGVRRVAGTVKRSVCAQGSATRSILPEIRSPKEHTTA